MCGPNLAICNPSLKRLHPTWYGNLTYVWPQAGLPPLPNVAWVDVDGLGRPNVRRFYFLRNRTRAHQVTGLSQDTLSKPVLSSPEES